MDNDVKKIMAWVLGAIITLLLGLLCYTGRRIIEGQDKMNDTLTTILVNQQDLNRRAIVLETDMTDLKLWRKEREEKDRLFWMTYDPRKRKE